MRGAILTVAVVSALLTSCAGTPPPTDKVSTADQAIQIAKANCDTHGWNGKWRAEWNTGTWHVGFNYMSAYMSISVASNDGKVGECIWPEF